MSKILYRQTAFDVAQLVTRNYSTSFFSATRLLDKEIRKAIFGIYGFVRLADEIVDTFSDFDQKELLEQFEKEYHHCRYSGISINPVIQAFHTVMERYSIEEELVEAFLQSMRADLTKKQYLESSETEEYIYGSAAAVGLMCLRVFTDGDTKLYEKLRYPAMKLGSAFQKVNFLRDLRYDLENLQRCYFSQINYAHFEENDKQKVISEIEKEFAEAYQGILLLPPQSRLGVYMAYTYYTQLLSKIKRTPIKELLFKRIRISDFHKILLFSQNLLRNKINLL